MRYSSMIPYFYRGASGTPPPPSYARSFDGVNQEFVRNDSAFLSMGAGVSWEFNGWLKRTDFSGYHGILSKGRLDYDIYANISDGQLIYASTNVSSVAAGPGSSTPDVIGAGSWYNVSLFYNFSTELLGVVLNGGTPRTTAMTEGAIDSIQAFSLGSLGGSSYFKGALTAWRLYKRNLTSVQRTYMAAQRRRHADLIVDTIDGQAMDLNLICSWDMEEVSGNAVDSESGEDLTDLNGIGQTTGPA